MLVSMPGMSVTSYSAERDTFYGPTKLSMAPVRDTPLHAQNAGHLPHLQAFTLLASDVCYYTFCHLLGSSC